MLDLGMNEDDCDAATLPHLIFRDEISPKTRVNSGTKT